MYRQDTGELVTDADGLLRGTSYKDPYFKKSDDRAGTPVYKNKSFHKSATRISSKSRTKQDSSDNIGRGATTANEPDGRKKSFSSNEENTTKPRPSSVNRV